MSDLFRNFDVEIEILTPVHVGKGVRLRRDYEFVTQRGVTYRLNEQAVLDDFWPDDPREQRLMLSKPPAELIRSVDLSNLPRYVLYSYRGEPAMGEVQEHIKDPFGQAYLPGSSLKGALRTLLLRTMIEGVAQQPIERKDIGYAMRDERDVVAAKSAAARLEARYAGADPNHSLFRGLAVSDTAPTAALALQRVQLVPGLEVDVEAIPARTTLRASVRVDRYVLVEKRDELGFEKAWAQTVAAFAKAANFTMRSRLEQEVRYHDARGQAAAARFYALLLQEAQAPDFDKGGFLLQVGFATGWRSKTLIGGLKDGNALLDQVVDDFHLGIGGKRGGAGPRQPGDRFPKARHLAMINGAPALPMGWMKVRFIQL